MDKEKLKILVVNDKVELRSIVCDYLRREGFSGVNVSENGLSALKKAAAEPPDLIVADYELPGLDGLQLLKAVREDKNLQSAQYILLAPELEQKFIAQAVEYGVNAFILKPFSHQTLITKVNELLQKKIDPTESDLLFEEANQMIQGGRLEDALEKYQEALAATKQAVASIHYGIGQIHEKLDEEGEAETSYNQALRLSDIYVDALDAMGRLNLKREKPGRALPYLRRSSDISPLNATRQLSLGEALLESDDFAGAEKAFKMALQLDPNQTHAFNRLGISLRRQGKLDEALEFFLRAADVTRDDENLYYNISRVFHSKGQAARAKKYLEHALNLNPEFKLAKDLLVEIETAAQAGSA